ncbi:MAG: hypothetical protein A2V77_00285 [Anaeromyxobacter sp. RBG_16_69_14]|nr:MAG: hypothetical protein A2V77_00285 [Anaeromyxobacter sp. RBG_16_69_14]
MPKRILNSKLVTYLALSLLLLACAAQRAESPAPAALKLTKDDMKYATIYVEPFTIAPDGVAEKEPAPHVEKAQSACVGQLATSGLFETVKSRTLATKQAAMIVRAELTSLRIVGGGARFWLGAMAGKSDMEFNVTLVDAQTGAVVSKSQVGDDTNAFGGAWTMGGTDKSLPGEVGARLAEFVVFGAQEVSARDMASPTR